MHPQLQSAARLLGQGFLEEARSQIVAFQLASPQRKKDMDAAVLKMWLMCMQPIETLAEMQGAFLQSVLYARELFGVGSARFSKFLHVFLHLCWKASLEEALVAHLQHWSAMEGLSEHARLVLRVYDAIVNRQSHPSDEVWVALARDATSIAADDKLRILISEHHVLHFTRRILQNTEPFTHPEQQHNIRQLITCHERVLELYMELYGEEVPATQQAIAVAGMAYCSIQQRERGCDYLRRAVRYFRNSIYINEQSRARYERVLRESEELQRRQASSN